MKLSEAIHRVTNDFGLSIMKDDNIINFLQDYSAFDDWKAAKYIIHILIQNATLNKLLVFINNKQTPSNLLKQMRKDLDVNYGIKENLITYVHNEIIDGFGLQIDKIESCSDSSDANKQTENKQDDTLKYSLSNQDDDDNHIHFKNISVHGDVNKVTSQLEAQGYIVTARGPEGIMLSGTYAGVTDCTIFVVVSPFINEVSSIFVHFPEHYSWWSLKTDYLKFKEKLTKKYGYPVSYEYFDSPYEEGDGYEDTAVKSDYCTYISIFKVDLGEIRLSITSDLSIAIRYIDGDGARKIEERQNQLSDLDL